MKEKNMIRSYLIFSLIMSLSFSLETFKCPQYKCGSSKQTACAISDENHEIIYTKAGICDLTKQYCNLNASQLYTNTSISAACVSKELPPINGVRYPGEACVVNADCKPIEGVNFKGRCSNLQCDGFEENELSASTLLCKAGLYSNGTNCVKQVSLGGKCKLTYDCKNDLVCYDGKCTQIFSIKDDYDINKVIDFGYELLCQYSNLSYDKKHCTKIDYTPEFSKRANSDNFVTCGVGDDCYYSDTLGGVGTQKCSCGLNKDGVSYCPKAPARCKIKYLFKILKN